MGTALTFIIFIPLAFWAIVMPKRETNKLSWKRLTIYGLATLAWAGVRLLVGI